MHDTWCMIHDASAHQESSHCMHVVSAPDSRNGHTMKIANIKLWMHRITIFEVIRFVCPAFTFFKDSLCGTCVQLDAAASISPEVIPMESPNQCRYPGYHEECKRNDTSNMHLYPGHCTVSFCRYACTRYVQHAPCAQPLFFSFPHASGLVRPLHH